MSLADDLLQLVEAVEQHTELPSVTRLYLPQPIEDPDRVAAFGAILLEDGSCGFFSAWLDETIDELAQFDEPRLLATPPAEIATWYRERNPIRSTIGFGAINAISQHIYRKSGYPLDTDTNSMGQLAFQPDDSVGMVGFFPPLVEKLTSRGIELLVIEKQTRYTNQDACSGDDYRISLNPADLSQCNKVLCTASTLLNHSVEEILSHCDPAARIALIGPTAGCLPDPLFDRGVDILGGTASVNGDFLMQRLNAKQEWGDSVQKYCIRRRGYPGASRLLASM